MNLKKSAIEVVFKFILVPLNIGMMVWIVYMNNAYIHPTAQPVSYPLRKKGYWQFTIYYMCLCIFSILVGLTNAFVVYSAFKYVPRRTHKFKSISTFSCCQAFPFYKAYTVFFLVFVGSYGLIGSIAFRNLFAKRAFFHVCDGYKLMAEIHIDPTFPVYDGSPESPRFDASSNIKFYKDNKLQYTMDLVREWNQTLGFGSLVKTQTTEKHWGTFDLALRVPEIEGPVSQFMNNNSAIFNDTDLYDGTRLPNGTTIYNSTWLYNITSLYRNKTLPTSPGGNNKSKENNTSSRPPGMRYFDASKLIEDQLEGVNSSMLGPIGNVHYNLLNSTYQITYTNTTAPGHPPITASGGFSAQYRDLSFPDLNLVQSRQEEWRFTDNVCLPPRVGLQGKFHLGDDIYGGQALACNFYRICALKKVYNDGGTGENWEEWWRTVEDTWATVVGIVSWEFERYSACCLRSE